MAALCWADCIARFVMWTMMEYLTEVWKISLVHAAGIVNIFSGLVLVLQLPVQYLADTIISKYWMLLASSLAYSAGIGFLTMSTPPVLAGFVGICSEYKPECIAEGHKILFYAALGLLAFASSCFLTVALEFAKDQLEIFRNENSSLSEIELRFLQLFFYAVPIAACTAISYIKPWNLRFGVSAICTVIATLLFLSGTCTYENTEPEGSPFTSVFRVFVASTTKLFYRLPRDASELYKSNDADDSYVVQPTCGLRCLDKAAIILPNKTIEQQERNRWRLCSVTEVEETKRLLQMIPICLTFIMPGVVSSIGNAFFVEQADLLNKKVGNLKATTVILLPFYDSAQKNMANIYTWCLCCFALMGMKKYVPVVGFAVSMIVAILCCITAAMVESRRLDVARSHGLIDEPDAEIPMSLFWLLPQFLLLGWFDGIRDKSIDEFFNDQCPRSLHKYATLFSTAVTGLGVIGGVLSVYLVGIISESKGKDNWFQFTLNHSRLDNYYWVLAAFTAANLVVYIISAKLLPLRDASFELLENFLEDAS
ncbi:protein NRT1/ PTR FAMILY 5.5 [Citrus sinensis]|uniref:Protein NRT1/ PTR FAMILY 5.5 n=1 Tax=Citrus sinensis TaxID=2711 RepID=A0ACB8JUU7_CITSI|nr:protein NRT1/ PTR FAMILY 5.5 [Citrus sinensis]